MIRETILVGTVLALAACGNGEEPATEQAGQEAPAAAQAEEQQRQQRQRVQELERELSDRDRRIDELEARVDALEDSLSAERQVPDRLIDSPRFGCVPWRQNPDLTVCTGQSLSSGW